MLINDNIPKLVLKNLCKLDIPGLENLELKIKENDELCHALNTKAANIGLISRYLIKNPKNDNIKKLNMLQNECKLLGTELKFLPFMNELSVEDYVLLENIHTGIDRLKTYYTNKFEVDELLKKLDSQISLLVSLIAKFVFEQ